MATFKSFEALAAHLKQVGRDVTRATEQATEQFADFLAERGQANAPVKTGALRDSIHKEPVSAPVGVTVRDVVADTPYAAAVHERPPDMDLAHEGEGTPEGHPGRQYLTRPVRFHREEFARDVRQRVNDALGGKA